MGNRLSQLHSGAMQWCPLILHLLEEQVVALPMAWQQRAATSLPLRVHKHSLEVLNSVHHKLTSLAYFSLDQYHNLAALAQVEQVRSLGWVQQEPQQLTTHMPTSLWIWTKLRRVSLLQSYTSIKQRKKKSLLLQQSNQQQHPQLPRQNQIWKRITKISRKLFPHLQISKTKIKEV